MCDGTEIGKEKVKKERKKERTAKDLSGMISLRDKVEDEEHQEAGGGEHECSPQRTLLPLPPLEGLVQNRAAVAGRDSHEHVQQEHRHRQAATVGGVHEPAGALGMGGGGEGWESACSF